MHFGDWYELCEKHGVVKSLVRRWALVSTFLVLGSCLWRPPVIPPLATPDSGTNPRESDAGFSVGTDSGSLPSDDSSTALTDEQACEAAARANDGSAPATVVNGGRVVNCGAIVGVDASTSDAQSADVDATVVDSSASDAGSDRVEVFASDVVDDGDVSEFDAVDPG